MPKFAPVCPANILRAFQQSELLGRYHLLLAHDIVANAKAYREVFNPTHLPEQLQGQDQEQYQDAAWRRQFDTVILDNSVIELGGAVDIDMIVKAAKIVRANVIVLPDVLLGGQESTDTTLSAIDSWQKALDKELSWEYSFMAVPQACTRSVYAGGLDALETFVDSCQQLAKAKRIGWWGIPRNLVGVVGSRIAATRLAHYISPERNIHLLGFSDRVTDDIMAARQVDIPVQGIDSAVPIRAASLQMQFQPVLPNLPPRGDWWDKAEYMGLMSFNLRVARKLFGDF